MKNSTNNLPLNKNLLLTTPTSLYKFKYHFNSTLKRALKNKSPNLITLIHMKINLKEAKINLK